MCEIMFFRERNPKMGYNISIDVNILHASHTTTQTHFKPVLNNRFRCSLAFFFSSGYDDL